jgi:hypothetical protein
VRLVYSWRQQAEVTAAERLEPVNFGYVTKLSIEICQKGQENV